jgi:hypothetical protein
MFYMLLPNGSFFPVPAVIIASEMDPHEGSHDEASLPNWQQICEPCDISSVFCKQAMIFMFHLLKYPYYNKCNQDGGITFY